MLVETLVGAGSVLVGGLAYARSRRLALYRDLAARLSSIRDFASIGENARPGRDLPSFAHRLAVIPDFLPADVLGVLRAEAEALARPERSFVPIHKQGGTVAYETMISAAPHIVSLYHARALQDLVSRLVGATVQPTPLHDQCSLAVLFYDKPGDHIGWHYDHNFYRGRHFTVLLPVMNEGASDDGLSHATLHAFLGGIDVEVGTPANMLVVFEGARVCHKVTPIREGERRLVISMTYCTDPRAKIWQAVGRRIKDTAFFGIRALWT